MELNLIYPSASSPASISQWKKFLQRCVIQRIDASDFRDFCRVMADQCPIQARDLIDIVLDARAVTNVEWDPLVPLYVDCLLKMKKLRIHDLLSSLLVHSTISHKSQQQQQQQKQQAADAARPSTLMTDYKIIQNLMLAATAGFAPDDVASAVDAFAAIADWILTLLALNDGGADSDKGRQPELLMNSPDALAILESLGILFAALLSTQQGVNALSKVKEGSRQKKKISQGLSSYLHFCSGMSFPLRNRLAAIQKEYNLYTEGDKALQESMMGGVNVSALEFESSVVDSPSINSRAGLFIYVNALLVGRPLVDDNMIINYLNNRYGVNRMLLVEELITAAFDVLSNGMYRNESPRTMFLFRSFLVNKLPPFLAELSASSVEPIPMELCITRVFSRIDPNAFPSFSEIFSMQGNSVLSDVRQEFLFSSALHKLIPESSIERLLGENPMQTLPVGGQYRKDSLVAQINSSPDRAEQLLNEIESMEGNAGAIVEAVIEVMHTLCSGKETMTLKNICNALTRRPQSLDIMLLFKSPSAILQPLCALLDAWKWDEEHGEKQPVYDEFGSILLLILAFKYKYDLTPSDLGIDNPDSFVLRLLAKGDASQKLEDLTEKQSQNLGAWISALFIAEGISDESMSSCSPQEFYLLVATLFSQSLGACESGKLEFETLKGGFEYLLEPFLLPALVMGLTWLGNHIWESESDLATSLKVLQALVKPSSISGEAQEIHRTVLLITANKLEERLKDIRSRQPSRTDIKPILETLESYHSFQRMGATRRSELDNWTAGGGGLISSIRNTFSSLVLWSTDPAISMTPPSYTHRQLLAGIHILGSVRVLHSLLDEIKLQAETGSTDLALDIAATLICAPLPESFAQEQTMLQHSHIDPSVPSVLRCRILTLRQALDLQHDNLAKTIDKDPHRAGLIVRLRRRVESLSVVPRMSMPGPGVSNMVDNIMGDITLEGMDVGDQPPQLDMPSTTAAGETSDAFNEMLGAVTSSGGVETGTGQVATSGPDPNQGIGLMDAAELDDVLGMADMGNPEFMDLDMEGMF